MIYFTSDYCEGCHPQILQRLTETNMEQTAGYGTDEHCLNAARLIRKECRDERVDVHFLVGGTQVNLTVIDAALRPHHGVVAAQSAHIQTHETGAVEATGHKILALPSDDGKITAAQVEAICRAHREDENREHTSKPAMVYISDPTELGTIYSKAELTALSETCRANGLYLFLDGARLGYGLMTPGNDLTMADLAKLCDVFYIGGTKVGALFGEAVVITNNMLKEDFRYMIKQHGGMLAKGRLLGIQFETLFEDGLYYRIASHALELANQMRDAFRRADCDFLVDSPTNQLFPILPDTVLAELSKNYAYTYQCRVSESHSAVRFCTSWATDKALVDQFCMDLLAAAKK